MPRKDVWSANGSRKKWVVDRVRERYAPCALCGRPINYQLKFPDAASFSVHHVIPQSEDPTRVFDLDNCVAAHLACNRIGGPSNKVAPQQAVTSRQW